jgi:hypothetical protein
MAIDEGRLSAFVGKMLGDMGAASSAVGFVTLTGLGRKRHC